MLNFKKGVYFISGIDTDIGKTIATGFLAQRLLAQNQTVITQKLVQTGCEQTAVDILQHRKMMQMENDDTLLAKLTAPLIFRYPASPHLAAELEQKKLDLAFLQQTTQQLATQYEIVLLEGAGGLMVPLTRQTLIIDYIQQHQYPVVLVTSGRLGSINHTLLSLAVLKQYQLCLSALVFNHVHDHQDPIISQDTQAYLKTKLAEVYPDAAWIDLPRYTDL